MPAFVGEFDSNTYAIRIIGNCADSGMPCAMLFIY
jgi:hypothetical protein